MLKRGTRRPGRGATAARQAAARFLGVLSVLSALACGGHGQKPPKAPQGALHVTPLAVSEDTFAREAATLFLSSQPSAERLQRIAGVVRFQLGRAAALYAAGHDEAGLAATRGALYLMREGEFDPSMLEGYSMPLLATANAVSREGSVGRAMALYSILGATALQSPDKDEVAAHRSAIRTFTDETRGKGPIGAAGTEARNLTVRALWEPSTAVVTEATAALVKWMERSLTYGGEDTPESEDLQRDEGYEARQAQQNGPYVLAALYLRGGNPGGALTALDSPRLSRFVPAPLVDLLRRAAENDDAKAWWELFSLFERSSAGTVEGIEPELLQAAAWGAAVELCHIEPKSLRGVMPVVTLLSRLGMSEVGPLLLRPVVEGGRAEAAASALVYVLEALSRGDRSGDLGSARRTFTNAAPLLAYVDKQPFVKDLAPSPARVRLAMGALEARDANLAAARPLVAQATAVEPTLAGLELLAAIERQRGNTDGTLGALSSIVKLATQTSDLTAVADAHEVEFEVLLERREPDRATKALEEALRRALDARQVARTGSEHAASERVLARVLEHYGELAGANRASERALDAARNDLGQVTATVLDAARRGLVAGDLRTTRTAVRRAIDANLPGDDLVYVAMWLRLLEQHLTVPSDGTVEEAFAKVDDTDGWPSRLRAFSLGRLSGDQLALSARSRAESTEAQFYAAMQSFAGGKSSSALLTPIAKSEAIELVEVAIARDLLARSVDFTAKVPKDIAIP